MSNQKVIDKGIKLCQLIDYARHRSRIPGARRVWPCNLTLQRPAWYGSFPPTQDWSYLSRPGHPLRAHFGQQVQVEFVGKQQDLVAAQVLGNVANTSQLRGP